ncbi:MAG: hypothetical protein AUJ49_08415 [Desulfovibrionaceae bacterium CG1_02_65_16]|nr:MAG: hypothetical protein AUJ49_08415 [Desulfovibrionaceae bacterium CG1_02_65_16]
MSGNWVQHIGDGQLVYGLPKHMEAVAGNGKTDYWEVVPGPNACATCKAMRGMRFDRYPGPVHPHCTCEIRRVPPPERQPRVVAYGLLQGNEDAILEKVSAGQKITVTLLNLGPLPAAFRLLVDRMEWRATRYLQMGDEQSLYFSKFGDTPMTWEVFLFYLGGEGSSASYSIIG